MCDKQLIQEEVRKTIEVFDNLENIEGNPYLYTRILTSLNNKSKAQLKLRYLLRIILFVGLLFTNVFSLLGYTSSTTQTDYREEYFSTIQQEYYSNVDDEYYNFQIKKDR